MNRSPTVLPTSSQPCGWNSRWCQGPWQPPALAYVALSLAGNPQHFCLSSFSELTLDQIVFFFFSHNEAAINNKTLFSSWKQKRGMEDHQIFPQQICHFLIPLTDFIGNRECVFCKMLVLFNPCWVSCGVKCQIKRRPQQVKVAGKSPAARVSSRDSCRLMDKL